ncbi:MAG TPA: hypothetical protein PLZ51_28390, partial [Aggregatilineales bacterium]|nr:hypothetical protein [Aggregatilineales bacterium]
MDIRQNDTVQILETDFSNGTGKRFVIPQALSELNHPHAIRNSQYNPHGCYLGDFNPPDDH